MAKPKFFYNEYTYSRGYPWQGTEAFTSGGGSESTVDLGRNLSNGIRLENTGSSGQVFLTLNDECPAGVWCAVLVEVTDFDLSNYSGSGGGNAPIKNATTTNINADTELADRVVTFDQLKAGGNGWYCIWMKYDVTTTPTIRVGIGTDGVQTQAGFMTVGRIGFFKLQQDNVEPSTVGGVPSFALPGNGAAYSVTGNSVDANKQVVWGTESIGSVDRFSVLYAIGDSKADEPPDAPRSLGSRAPIACYTYARSGQGYDYMLSNLSDLQARRVDNNEEVQRDVWADMDEFPQTPLRPNALIFSNFGVNDINGATYTPDEEITNFTGLASSLGFSDVILTEINPWGANSGASASEITETVNFNALARSTAKASGWVFVPLYYALGDRPSNPDNLSSTYTTDDLHPIAVGSTVVNGQIKCAIDEYLQRVN